MILGFPLTSRPHRLALHALTRLVDCPIFMLTLFAALFLALAPAYSVAILPGHDVNSPRAELS
jgi:hypothetical protein